MATVAISDKTRDKLRRLTRTLEKKYDDPYTMKEVAEMAINELETRILGGAAA